MGSQLAKRLEEARDGVLQRWEDRARRTIPDARNRPELILLDGLPNVIDELVHSVAAAAAAPAREEKSHNAAHHGRQRATTTAFSLDQVLHEYALLRAVLFEVLEEAGPPLTSDEREALLTRVELRVRTSAREFVRVRDEERDGARRSLEDLNLRLAEAVKERTEELRRTERRFEVLVEGVRDYAIFTLDPRGFITSWNKGAERMKGYTAEEAIGAHFAMLYPLEARFRDEPMTHLGAAVAKGRFRGEGLRRRRSGEEFLADVLITPMYEGQELTGFSKIVQDVSERSSLLQERDLLRLDAERLRNEAEYRERFVASLSHDLRSPLSTAKTGAEILATGTTTSAKTVDLAEKISRSIDRADHMIVDMLDASRIDSGQKLKLELEDCDLLAIAQQVGAELSARHGPRFRLIAEGATTGRWNADALRRVLDNLLSNAIKYGSPGTPVTVRLRRRQKRMIIFVHNQGPTIPLADQSQLFEAFRRSPEAEKSGREGWGLGLALVRGIVEALQGEVSVASYPNEGTTFTVDLPLAPEG